MPPAACCTAASAEPGRRSCRLHAALGSRQGRPSARFRRCCLSVLRRRWDGGRGGGWRSSGGRPPPRRMYNGGGGGGGRRPSMAIEGVDGMSSASTRLSAARRPDGANCNFDHRIAETALWVPPWALWARREPWACAARISVWRDDRCEWSREAARPPLSSGLRATLGRRRGAFSHIPVYFRHRGRGARLDLRITPRSNTHAEAERARGANTKY